MQNKVFATFDEAVADIPDGCTVAFAGFGNVGFPRNLIAALHRQGATNMEGISNNAGALDDRVDVGLLVGAGRFKKNDLRLYRRHAPFEDHGLREDVQRRRN